MIHKPNDVSFLHNGEKTTFIQTYNQSIQIANVLKTQYNVEPGDIVGHLGPFTPFTCQLGIATQLLNAIILPLPLIYPPKKLEESINIFNEGNPHFNDYNHPFTYPKIILTTENSEIADNVNVENKVFIDDFMTQASALATESPYYISSDTDDSGNDININGREKEISNLLLKEWNINKDFDWNNLSYMNLGTGTTGNPKLISFTNSYFKYNCKGNEYWWSFDGFDKHKKMIQTLTTTNCISMLFVYGAIYGGFENHFHNLNKYGKNIWKSIQENESQILITLTSFINENIHFLDELESQNSNNNNGKLDLTSLNCITICGECTHRSKVRQLALKLGTNQNIKLSDDLKIVNTHGCNEMGAQTRSFGLNVKQFCKDYNQCMHSGNFKDKWDIDESLNHHFEQFDYLHVFPGYTHRGSPKDSNELENLNVNGAKLLEINNDEMFNIENNRNLKIYINNKKASENAFTFDKETNKFWFRANDVIEYNPKNSDEYKVIGRYDDLIKVNSKSNDKGYVNPMLIEDLVFTQYGNQIEECVVVSCDYDTDECNGVAIFVQFAQSKEEGIKQDKDEKWKETFHQDVNEMYKEKFDEVYQEYGEIIVLEKKNIKVFPKIARVHFRDEAKNVFKLKDVFDAKVEFTKLTHN